jgi:hypothetical protein
MDDQNVPRSSPRKREPWNKGKRTRERCIHGRIGGEAFQINREPTG